MSSSRSRIHPRISCHRLCDALRVSSGLNNTSGSLARDSIASRVVERHALSDVTSLRETLTRYYDSCTRSCAISHGRKRGFRSPEWIGKNDEGNSAASWQIHTRGISSSFFIFVCSVFYPVCLSCDVDVQLSHQHLGGLELSGFLSFAIFVSWLSSIPFTRSLHVFVANSISHSVASDAP